MSWLPEERIRRLLGRPPMFPDLAHSHAHFKLMPQTEQLKHYEFAIVDTELTGMDPKSDEIVSIGAVRIRNMRLVPEESFYAVVRPEMDLPKVSTMIHRITPEDVENAPPLAAVLPSFLDFVRHSLIVGHHVGMDMSFLNKASKRHLGAGFANPCLDTLRMAQAFQEQQWTDYYEQYNLKISYNLNDLAEKFDLPVFDAHNALMDAFQAAYLFLFLAGKLNKGRVRTLKDLHHAARPWRFI